MKITDLPEVKHLSDVLTRLDESSDAMKVELSDLKDGRPNVYSILGKDAGYSSSLSLQRIHTLNGCYIGVEMALATIHILDNKKQQVLARLAELGVSFPSSKPFIEEDTPSL